MFANLTGMHLLVLVLVILLLFGATKLPALARGAGQSVRILRSEVRAAEAETDAPSDGASGPARAESPRQSSPGS